jgi:hypothetical protein
MRLLQYFYLIGSLIMDFLWAPLWRIHIREVVLRVPVLPGQIWNLPGLGDVRVTWVTDDHVKYRVETDVLGDEYTCRRRDFVIHSIKDEEVKIHPPKLGLVIPFNLKDKES